MTDQAEHNRQIEAKLDEILDDFGHDAVNRTESRTALNAKAKRDIMQLIAEAHGDPTDKAIGVLNRFAKGAEAHKGYVPKSELIVAASKGYDEGVKMLAWRIDCSTLISELSGWKGCVERAEEQALNPHLKTERIARLMTPPHNPTQLKEPCLCGESEDRHTVFCKNRKPEATEKP